MKPKTASKCTTTKRSNANKTAWESTLASTQQRAGFSNLGNSTIFINGHEGFGNHREPKCGHAEAKLNNTMRWNNQQVLGDENRIDYTEPQNVFFSQVNSNREDFLINKELFKEERARRAKRRSHSFNKNFGMLVFILNSN